MTGLFERSPSEISLRLSIIKARKLNS